jgi:hypothetical protein
MQKRKNELNNILIIELPVHFYRCVFVITFNLFTLFINKRFYFLLSCREKYNVIKCICEDQIANINTIFILMYVKVLITATT